MGSACARHTVFLQKVCASQDCEDCIAQFDAYLKIKHHSSRFYKRPQCETCSGYSVRLQARTARPRPDSIGGLRYLQVTCKACEESWTMDSYMKTPNEKCTFNMNDNAAVKEALSKIIKEDK